MKAKDLRRTPFYIISFGNAILLITTTVLVDYCDHFRDKDPSCEDKETKIEILRGLVILECMAVAFMWVKYIMAVKKFKKDNNPPDLYRPEFREQVLGLRSSGCLSRQSELEAPAVYRPPESREEIDILEKQTELLLYLCPAIGLVCEPTQF